MMSLPLFGKKGSVISLYGSRSQLYKFKNYDTPLIHFMLQKEKALASHKQFRGVLGIKLLSIGSKEKII